MIYGFELCLFEEMFGNAWETLFCSGVLPAAACAGSPLAHTTTTAAGAPVLSKTDFLGETFPFSKNYILQICCSLIFIGAD